MYSSTAVAASECRWKLRGDERTLYGLTRTMTRLHERSYLHIMMTEQPCCWQVSCHGTPCLYGLFVGDFRRHEVYVCVMLVCQKKSVALSHRIPEAQESGISCSWLAGFRGRVPYTDFCFCTVDY